jgi:sugar phosphate isomerase/epimerase
MKDSNYSGAGSRRAWLKGMIALAGGALWEQKHAGNALSAEKKYAPRIVCNMYYFNMLFRTPFQYIPSRPDPRNGPPPAQPPITNNGMVWTDEQWDSALSDVKYAGYKRMELVSTTVMGTPVDKIIAHLDKYGLVINHIWHGGKLYPEDAAEKTIAGTIELLDKYSKPLKTPEFIFDPFGGKGPQSYEDAKTQSKSLDRIGKEVVDRGMKLYVHNHETPMLYNAREWLFVLHNTNPVLVSMCLDMDWTWQAGIDPLPLMYEAGDSGRLGALHMRTQHNMVMDETMMDGGDIDYYKVADYLKKIQFNGPLVEESVWMKETKITRSARDNKREARKWCEKVFGVSAGV